MLKSSKSRNNSNNNPKKGYGCLMVTGALIIGVFGGGYLLSRTFLGQELTASSGAKIIPEEALMAGFISTESENWSKLEQFTTPETKQMISNNLQNYTNSLTNNNQDIDYQKDIQPWLSGIMLTILPSSPANADINLVAIVGIKNKIRAWQFLQKIKTQPKFKITESNYNNITIYQNSDDQGNIIWTTFFKNYLVISLNQENLEQVIDTFQGENSLANKSQSGNLFSQKLNLNNPVAQIYFPSYAEFVKNSLNDSNYGQNLPPETQQQLEEVNSLVMGVGIEDEGIHCQGIANLETPIDETQLENVSNRLISQMPNNTILMANGQGINQLWAEIEKQKTTNPQLNQIISQWQDTLKISLDIDLEKDVFSWLNGEFAFGLFPENNNSLGNSGLGGLVLIETGDRQTAENTLTKHKNVPNQLPFIQITEENKDGITITKWQTIQSPLFSYGWLNNQDLMITLGTDFSTTQNIEEKNSLANNQTFQLTTESLPADNFGYLYFDIEKAFDLYQKMANETSDLMPKETEEMINSLKAIAITTSLINPNTPQVDLVLTVETNNQ